jgi:3-oxoacyl-[acyl-carrier protein] reductase
MLTLNLSHKIALVTGATGQLGRVIARTLADCGADVAIHYNSNEAQAQELVAEFRGLGVRSLAVQANVGQRDSVFAMRDAVAAELGHPDIIVNNAVQQYKWTTVLEQAEADYESQFRTCVLQNVFMAQAFVPAMQAQRWGRVIAINTECAAQCGPTTSAYIAGKRGMDGVLRVLAKEIGEFGITVNQVAPGWTVSEQYREAGTERAPTYEAALPLKRRSEDFDIANAVAFLASDLGADITGAFLPVCSGAVMLGI